jgi:Cys-rich protein (TIGR01571 family)
MAQVKGNPSVLACCSMLVGMLLLSFAGIVMVMSPQSLVVELRKQSSTFLEGTRRLGTDPLTGQYIPIYTTTRPSIFDSSDSSFSGSSLESSKSLESDSSSSGMTPQNEGVSVAGDSAAYWTGIFIDALIMTCFAAIYYQNAVEPVLQTGNMLTRYGYGYKQYVQDDFDNGICDCFSDMWVCIHGLCCPLVRMAHTNAVAGIHGYWQSVLIYFCCQVVGCGIGPCCLMVYWRKQLKDIMGIEDHILNDAIVTCCCPGLSICQQATAVDQAMGYEVTGCCTLEYGDGSYNNDSY